jgi:hypothetical protein
MSLLFNPARLPDRIVAGRRNRGCGLRSLAALSDSAAAPGTACPSS